MTFLFLQLLKQILETIRDAFIERLIEDTLEVVVDDALALVLVS